MGDLLLKEVLVCFCHLVTCFVIVGVGTKLVRFVARSDRLEDNGMAVHFKHSNLNIPSLLTLIDAACWEAAFCAVLQAL